eukprot:265030_1
MEASQFCGTDKEKKLLILICNNILTNSKDSKFRNLNYNKIAQKLSEKSLYLLLKAGFKQNGHRLTLNANDMDKIKILHESLTTEPPQYNTMNDVNDRNNAMCKPKISNKNNSKKSTETPKKYSDPEAMIPVMIELMDNGKTVDEAETYASHLVYQEQRTMAPTDMLEAVYCFVENGFEYEQSMTAVVQAKYDIKQALNILIFGFSQESPEDNLHKLASEAIKKLIASGHSQELSEERIGVDLKEIQGEREYEEIMAGQYNELLRAGLDKNAADKMMKARAINFLLSKGYDRDSCIKALEKTNYHTIKARLELEETRKMPSKQRMDALCANLMILGFDKELVIKALKIANFEVDEAAQILLDGEIDDSTKLNEVIVCNGGIEIIDGCQQVKLLTDLLKRVDIKDSHDQFQPNLPKILDYFHHILDQHKSDEELETIYNMLGKCDILHCHKFRRNRRDRIKQTDSEEIKQETVSFAEDIMDKIHCTLYHSTDIGYRLNNVERKQIEETLLINNNNGKMDIEFGSDWSKNNQLLQLKKIIISKQQLLKSVNSEGLEKFSSKHDSYDFGQCFVYWNYFKEQANIAITDDDDRHACSYIHPKFSCMKEELIKNRFSKIYITMEQWNHEYQKAFLHKNSYHFKGMTAKPEKERASYTNPLANSIAFGIKEGTEISEKHLLAMMFYCNYDQLSYEFSKTYRRLDENDFSDDDWK